jgi:hypothetical protein
MPVSPSAAVHAAAEVHQPLGAVDEGREQVRGDDVDGQDRPAGVDAGVVDHGVHPAEPVDLFGDVPGLVEVGQVSGYGHGPAVEEFAHSGESLPAAGVDDDLVPVVEEGSGGRSTEAVG